MRYLVFVLVFLEFFFSFFFVIKVVVNQLLFRVVKQLLHALKICGIREKKLKQKKFPKKHCYDHFK